MDTPHLTRIADLQQQRNQFPAKPYIARPVEEFERPLRGETEEQPRSIAQQAVIASVWITAMGWTGLIWWLFFAAITGVR